MKKISGSTFYYKKVFPAVWFGFLAFFFFTSLTTVTGQQTLLFLGAPVLMAAIGFFLFKKIVWDLVDEVYDHGYALEFRKGNKRQQVNLQDIINIEHSRSSNPERVVIHARYDGAIGKELVFCPPVRWNLFSKSPLVRELIERVDNARNC